MRKIATPLFTECPQHFNILNHSTFTFRMILGTYWYFDFPIDLYKFDYFEFSKGYGGHADNPAELIAFFEAEHPEKMVEDLQQLVNKYSDGFLFIYQEAHKLKIGTGYFDPSCELWTHQWF